MGEEKFECVINEKVTGIVPMKRDGSLDEVGGKRSESESANRSVVSDSL